MYLSLEIVLLKAIAEPISPSTGQGALSGPRQRQSYVRSFCLQGRAYAAAVAEVEFRKETVHMLSLGC